MNAAIGIGDVEVRYQFTDALTADDTARGLELLSAAERTRAARFVFDRDRIAFVAAHALLRRVLSAHGEVPPAEWTFVENAFGKPALEPGHDGLTFNLAHTRGLVACAVCRQGEVGLDVEAIRPDMQSLDIARRFFSSAELAALESCADGDRPARFTDLWALKESYVKAIGQGLSHALDTFSFTLTPPSRIVFQPPPGDAATWQFALFAPSPHHRLAVAVTRGAGAARRITARRDDGAGDLRAAWE